MLDFIGRHEKCFVSFYYLIIGLNNDCFYKEQRKIIKEMFLQKQFNARLTRINFYLGNAVNKGFTEIFGV